MCKQMVDVKLSLLYSNTWNHLTVCQKKAQVRFRMLFTKYVYKSYMYLIYMYKKYLELNNLQWLVCHKTKPNHNFHNSLILTWRAWFGWQIIKNLFLRKKSNRPSSALDLAKVEKGEVIPDNAAPKSYLPLFVKNYYWDPQYEFGDQTEKQEKRVSSLTSWIASQEIKVKLNESRLLKFYQFKQLKENLTENCAEKMTLQKTRN